MPDPENFLLQFFSETFASPLTALRGKILGLHPPAIITH